jgi:hypothetical protein
MMGLISRNNKKLLKKELETDDIILRLVLTKLGIF